MMTSLENPPGTSVPARSIVVMAEGVGLDELGKTFTQFKNRIIERYLPDLDVERWSRIYPGLRALILPISASEALESGMVRPGYEGVIVVDDERKSFAPPGAELHDQRVQAADPLEATRVVDSRRCGAGICVMLLDVGLDTDHPDFKNRRPKPQLRSFVADPLPNDSGHGTRSTGLACGPRQPYRAPRYGIASCADVIAGQVVSEANGLLDEALLAGIQAAIAENVAIVNLSLGQEVAPTSSYNLAFEEIAHRALKADLLLIAAAGNDEHIGAPGVKHPANCPSVLAVGAVDGELKPWPGSCVRLRCDGEVDLVAPGYQIRSSTAGYELYNIRSSTSSACAIASGIAALWAEATGRRGCDLWNTLLDEAVSVRGGRRRMTGAGLVQAPLI